MDKKDEKELNKMDQAKIAAAKAVKDTKEVFKKKSKEVKQRLWLLPDHWFWTVIIAIILVIFGLIFQAGFRKDFIDSILKLHTMGRVGYKGGLSLDFRYKSITNDDYVWIWAIIGFIYYLWLFIFYKMWNGYSKMYHWLKIYTKIEMENKTITDPHDLDQMNAVALAVVSRVSKLDFIKEIREKAGMKDKLMSNSKIGANFEKHWKLDWVPYLILINKQAEVNQDSFSKPATIDDRVLALKFLQQNGMIKKYKELRDLSNEDVVELMNNLFDNKEKSD